VAKYTGAAEYDQPLHRDYLTTHSSCDLGHEIPAGPRMFMYLCDVAGGGSPAAFVSRRARWALPLFPNWLFARRTPDWFEAEYLAGTAGTVVHSGPRNLPPGDRASSPSRRPLHASGQLPRRTDEWAGRIAWGNVSMRVVWLVSASVPVLLFGFRRPDILLDRDTLAGMGPTLPAWTSRPSFPRRSPRDQAELVRRLANRGPAVITSYPDTEPET